MSNINIEEECMQSIKESIESIKVSNEIIRISNASVKAFNESSERSVKILNIILAIAIFMSLVSIGISILR